MNAPGSTTCKTCGLPRASRAWFFFRDAAESHEPCRAARRYDRRSTRVRDRELDAKLEALRGGPPPRRVHGLDPTRKNPDLPREVVQGIFAWTHGYATVEDAVRALKPRKIPTEKDVEDALKKLKEECGGNVDCSSDEESEEVKMNRKYSTALANNDSQYFGMVG